MTVYSANLGDIVYGKSGDVLRVIALGSCVGTIIYSSKKKIAALAHIALPYFVENKNLTNETLKKPGRYADIAIDTILEEMKKKGIQKEELFAKLVGGSNMFGTKNILMGPGLNIGERNIESVQSILKENRISVTSTDLRGETSRTVEFEIETCILKVRRGIGEYSVI